MLLDSLILLNEISKKSNEVHQSADGNDRGMSVLFHHVQDMGYHKLRHDLDHVLIGVSFFHSAICNVTHTVGQEFIESFFRVNCLKNLERLILRSIFINCLLILTFNLKVLTFSKVEREPVSKSLSTEGLSDLHLGECSHVHKVHGWIYEIDQASSWRSFQ